MHKILLLVLCIGLTTSWAMDLNEGSGEEFTELTQMTTITQEEPETLSQSPSIKTNEPKNYLAEQWQKIVKADEHILMEQRMRKFTTGGAILNGVVALGALLYCIADGNPSDNAILIRDSCMILSICMSLCTGVRWYNWHNLKPMIENPRQLAPHAFDFDPLNLQRLQIYDSIMNILFLLPVIVESFDLSKATFGILVGLEALLVICTAIQSVGYYKNS